MNYKVTGKTINTINMTNLQKLKEKARKEFKEKIEKRYRVDICGKAYIGCTDDKNSVIDVVRWHPFNHTMQEFIDSLITKAYKEGKRITKGLCPVGEIHTPIKKNLKIMTDITPYKAKKAIEEWLEYHRNSTLEIRVCCKYILIDEGCFSEYNNLFFFLQNNI